jgi:hypothetical protein
MSHCAALVYIIGAPNMTECSARSEPISALTGCQTAAASIHVQFGGTIEVMEEDASKTFGPAFVVMPYGGASEPAWVERPSRGNSCEQGGAAPVTPHTMGCRTIRDLRAVTSSSRTSVCISIASPRVRGHRVTDRVVNPLFLLAVTSSGDPSKLTGMGGQVVVVVVVVVKVVGISVGGWVGGGGGGGV